MQNGIIPIIFIGLGILSLVVFLVFENFFRHKVSRIAAGWVQYGSLGLTAILSCSGILLMEFQSGHADFTAILFYMFLILYFAFRMIASIRRSYYLDGIVKSTTKC